MRLKRDVLARSYVGLMATAVNRFERPFDEAPQPGDFCPDGDSPADSGRCTHDAYSGAVDFNVRTSDGNWGAIGQVAATLLAAGPQRSVPDGTILGPGTSGVGLALDGGKFNGKYTAQLEYRGWSPGFDNNDLGFNQVGQRACLPPDAALPHLEAQLDHPGWRHPALGADPHRLAISRICWRRSTGSAPSCASRTSGPSTSKSIT